MADRKALKPGNTKKNLSKIRKPSLCIEKNSFFYSMISMENWENLLIVFIIDSLTGWIRVAKTGFFWNLPWNVIDAPSEIFQITEMLFFLEIKILNIPWNILKIKLDFEILNTYTNKLSMPYFPLLYAFFFLQNLLNFWLFVGLLWWMRANEKSWEFRIIYRFI